VWDVQFRRIAHLNRAGGRIFRPTCEQHSVATRTTRSHALPAANVPAPRVPHRRLIALGGRETSRQLCGGSRGDSAFSSRCDAGSATLLAIMGGATASVDL